MKKLLFSALISLFLTHLNAQQTQFNWAKSIGGNNVDNGVSITTDANGNVYSTGEFEGTVDFNPDFATYFLTGGCYALKLDANGSLVWAQSVEGKGISIAVDDNRNVYLLGEYTGTIDADPGSSVFNLTSNGGRDYFIIKFDSFGSFLWAKSTGGANFEYPKALALDAKKNVYVAGNYTGNVDFDPGSTVFNLSSKSIFHPDFFIQKLDSNGNFIWAKSIGSRGFEEVSAITTDSIGNVYATGSYRDTLDFDPGPAVFNLVPPSIHEAIFILNLDTAGNFVWAKSVAGGGPLRDKSNSIVLDIDGNILITGRYSGIVDFDPGPAVFNLADLGIYILKLNNRGGFLWAKSIKGGRTSQGHSVITDQDKNIYTTGVYSGTIDFDPNSSISNLTARGVDDIFIQKLDSSGNFIWAKSMGGIHVDGGRAITIDTKKNIYTTGYYKYTVDFDPDTGVFDLTTIHPDHTDIFIQKLGQCHLNVNIRVANSNIMSDATGVSYQWLDCNNGYAIIQDATEQVFTPTKNGVYAVEIIENNCIDTSNCVTISTVGLEEKKTELEDIIVFPNPNQGLININLGNLKEASLNIYNLNGQLVFVQNQINTFYQFEFNTIPGIYIVEIESKGERQRFKLIKN